MAEVGQALVVLGDLESEASPGRALVAHLPARNSGRPEGIAVPESPRIAMDAACKTTLAAWTTLITVTSLPDVDRAPLECECACPRRPFFVLGRLQGFPGEL